MGLGRPVLVVQRTALHFTKETDYGGGNLQLFAGRDDLLERRRIQALVAACLGKLLQGNKWEKDPGDALLA